MPSTITTLHQQNLETPTGRVQFLDVGSGLPVLYFHGTGAGNDAAVLLEEQLMSSGCRLIVPNRPGYFGTAPGPRGSVEHCAALALHLLDHLQVRRAAVVGTSGGGMPAAAFARLYPERTAALVLQCAQAHRWDHGRWLPRGIERSLFLFRHPVFYPLLKWYNRLHARGLRGQPEQCIREMSGSRAAPLLKDAAILQTMAALTELSVACAAQPRGIENDWAILVGDNGIRAGAISCPTLIIHDREDPLVPFAHAEWSQAAIRQARLLEVHAGGHLIWFGPDAKRMQEERRAFLGAQFSVT